MRARIKQGQGPSQPVLFNNLDHFAQWFLRVSVWGVLMEPRGPLVTIRVGGWPQAMKENWLARNYGWTAPGCCG